MKSMPALAAAALLLLATPSWAQYSPLITAPMANNPVYGNGYGYRYGYGPGAGYGYGPGSGYGHGPYGTNGVDGNGGTSGTGSGGSTAGSASH